MAAACAEGLRPGDLLARWGGKEFVALLPGAGQPEAARIAGRLRSAVAGGQVTVSIGMSCTQSHPATLDALLSAADHARYQAKRAGKNRVTAAWGTPPSRTTDEWDVTATLRNQ